jgi:hypothetical protein
MPVLAVAAVLGPPAVLLLLPVLAVTELCVTIAAVARSVDDEFESADQVI